MCHVLHQNGCLPGSAAAVHDAVHRPRRAAGDDEVVSTGEPPWAAKLMASLAATRTPVDVVDVAGTVSGSPERGGACARMLTT